MVAVRVDIKKMVLLVESEEWVSAEADSRESASKGCPFSMMDWVLVKFSLNSMSGAGSAARFADMTARWEENEGEKVHQGATSSNENE